MRPWVVAIGAFGGSACALIADLPDYLERDETLAPGRGAGGADGGARSSDAALVPDAMGSGAQADGGGEVPVDIGDLGCAAAATNGLIAHWQLDEQTGSTATDCSPQALEGSIAAGVGHIAGRVGAGALGFDGSGFVGLGDPAPLQITGAMTIAAWVRIDAFDTSGRVVAKAGGLADRGWELYVEADGTGHFTIASDASSVIGASAPPLPIQAWFHFAGVYEPSVAVRIYVDGIEVGETTTSVPAAQRNSPSLANIGRRAGDTCCGLKGQVDDLRVFGRALVAGDVTRLARQ